MVTLCLLLCAGTDTRDRSIYSNLPYTGQLVPVRPRCPSNTHIHLLGACCFVCSLISHHMHAELSVPVRSDIPAITLWLHHTAWSLLVFHRYGSILVHLSFALF